MLEMRFVRLPNRLPPLSLLVGGGRSRDRHGRRQGDLGPDCHRWYLRFGSSRAREVSRIAVDASSGRGDTTRIRQTLRNFSRRGACFNDGGSEAWDGGLGKTVMRMARGRSRGGNRGAVIPRFLLSETNL